MLEINSMMQLVGSIKEGLIPIQNPLQNTNKQQIDLEKQQIGNGKQQKKHERIYNERVHNWNRSNNASRIVKQIRGYDEKQKATKSKMNDHVKKYANASKQAQRQQNNESYARYKSNQNREKYDRSVAGVYDSAKRKAKRASRTVGKGANYVSRIRFHKKRK